ncbi:sensor histidine kinase [Chitinophaga nivalis]|uniref:Histidine kinase n=1 Tax=Chitinophaga nivalis TaxID=2991709 RepID=A0ABT3IMP8_9BACT|nr:histidine kinase [Chitinophaga nivalis]MCW3465304.1 histidine kinase [Chitinophaga nivalis]MCW3485004.1 histidine kinase [Chitinophaga nivalis]
MHFPKRTFTPVMLQWLVWLFVLLLLFFSLLSEDSFGQAASFSLINTAFYAVVIYGNIDFLYPRLYLKGHRWLYIIATLLFLIVLGMSRGYLVMTLYNTFFAKYPEPITMVGLVRNIVGMVLIYVLSFIFRIAIAYFTLKRQTEEMMLQKTRTELNLLKSQVQPHFLFNTLNNIYYEAYREAPRTAHLIERLSEIMRYFVDESPKEKVQLSTETAFLKNYITLEKIRIRHEITLEFHTDVQENCEIPPMLLMTFVENIFKHGIDKSSTTNQINISLVQEAHRLLFRTCNGLPVHTTYSERGSGIANLRKRLDLLYGNNYTLTTEKTAGNFIAFLSVPL